MIDKKLILFPGADSNITDASLIHSLSISDYILVATAFILLFSVIITWLGHLHNTRPILRVYLKGNPRGLRINPIIENYSKSDAVAGVLMNVIVGELKFIYPTAYNGKELFYVPAGGFFHGNVDLYSEVHNRIGDKMRSAKVFLEFSMYYRRFPRPGNFAFSEFIFKLLRFFPRITRGAFRFNRIYSAPMTRWKFDFKRYIWISEPNTVIARKPEKMNLSVLFQNPS